MYLAHDDRQKVNFLFRLYQPRNNRSKFIEYLVPALHLTAIFRALHGFISNEGKFRLAVSEILKDGHVVRTVYGLIFYSQLRRLNLVSLRVGKVHGGNHLLVQNNLVVFTSIPELLPIWATSEYISGHPFWKFLRLRGLFQQPRVDR